MLASLWPRRTWSHSAGGYRLYDDVAVRRLGFIIKAKSLGLTLAEIRQILAVHDSGKCPCDSVRWTLQAHAEQIDRQIVRLKALRAELHAMLTDWRPPSQRNGKTTMTGTIGPRIEAPINGTRHLIRKEDERR